MAKLCLGTVQFGMKYGINNQIGRQPTKEECFEMLDYAMGHGIEAIDTAAAYGGAELLLGEYFGAGGIPKNLKIISKLCPNIIGEEERDVYKTMKKEIEGSLKRIGIDRLDGYLLHTPEYIYNEKIVAALARLKEEGYTRNVGVSIYDIKEGEAAIRTGVIDYIQLPYSILDQRGAREGFFSKAKKAGMTVFTRSAFLQGLFMMEAERVPSNLRHAVPYLEKIDEIACRQNVDKVSAILHFVKAQRDVDYLVFGVEEKKQLTEDIDKFENGIVPEELISELGLEIDNCDESIIFPSLWADGGKESSA